MHTMFAIHPPTYPIYVAAIYGDGQIDNPAL